MTWGCIYTVATVTCPNPAWPLKPRPRLLLPKPVQPAERKNRVQTQRWKNAQDQWSTTQTLPRPRMSFRRVDWKLGPLPSERRETRMWTKRPILPALLTRFLIMFCGFGWVWYHCWSLVLWLKPRRYVTAFGVYQGIAVHENEDRKLNNSTDFYTQHYLTNETSSAISWVFPASTPWVPFKVSHRWIGSTNAFLATSVSLISGALYDRGYLWVQLCCRFLTRKVIMLC